MAHRLQLPGKCQNIHGHSWICTLEVFGDPDEHGIIIDFHVLKDYFKMWLDNNFDHRLMLWEKDPWLMSLKDRTQSIGLYPPGLIIEPWDPTTENVAKFIGQIMRKRFGLEYRYRVVLEEGLHNGASWEG
jgi:6-pyruvoyltetrahydropterin/6-carboxytetrahydropterin synthase